MYKYETHLHTSPVSKCARADVREVLELYKSMGYEGIFLTNHFLDGNINIDRNLPYEERIAFYFSDYEKAKELEKEIGIAVFCGLELSYRGTDFLIYGLDKEWLLKNPQIMDMSKKEELAYLASQGALVIHAHPYRESGHIDHIRLFPRSVHGVEVINANRNELENSMAEHYAKSYGLLEFAGSDNHVGAAQKRFAGMMSDTPIVDEVDFVERVKKGELKTFFFERD